MINKLVLSLVFILSSFNAPFAFSESETKVDFCSVGFDDLTNGEEINYLARLGYTAIPESERVYFSETWLRSQVQSVQAEPGYNGEIYIASDAGIDKLYLVDAEIHKYPQPIKLSQFAAELDHTDLHYLAVLGAYADTEEPEKFPYTADEIERLVSVRIALGSDEVFIQTKQETATVNDVKKTITVKYIYIVNAEYYDPIGIPIADFIHNLNSVESILNDYGLSIRDGGDFSDGDEENSSGNSKGVNLYAIFNDPVGFQEQVLDAVRLEVSQFAGKCLSQIAPKDCPQINRNDVYSINGVDPTTKIDLGSGPRVTVDEFVLAVNTSALAACAAGYYLFGTDGTSSDFWPEFDPSSGDSGLTWARFNIHFLSIDGFVLNIFGKLDSAFISIDGDFEFLSPLLLHFKTEFGSFDALALEFRGYANDVETYFMNLIGWDDDGNGTSIEIPNIFEYKAVEIAAAPPLEITKEYDWIGLDVGSESTLAANVFAHAEMRAGEHEITNSALTTHAFAHYARATAEANVIVFNNKATLASAASAAYVGLDRVSAQMDAQILGYNWNDEELGVDENHPLVSLVETYNNSNSQSQTIFQTVIPIGPIPLVLHAGAFVRSGLFVEYGLVSLKVFAKAKPYVAAGLTASARLDIWIAQVGVEAGLTLIDVGIPVTAHAALLHTDNNEPYIDLNLNGDATYRILDGYLTAYAQYMVPRFGLPPWKKKRINKVLFTWTGMGASQSIFSWGATLGKNGLEMRGNALTMGITELNEGSTLNDKVIAIISYQGKTRNRINDSLTAVQSQIDFAEDSVGMTLQGVAAIQNLSSDMLRYDMELTQVFDNEDPLQRDTDGDGALDVVEAEEGTNPLLADSDDDGIPDNYELLNSYLDPNNSADALLDTDGDGFSNLDEFLVSSDPLNENITPENITAIIMIPILGLILH
jgi:hypothetical protein